MVAGLASLALSIKERSARWLKPACDVRAIALALIIIAPWFIAIALDTHGAFFSEAVGGDMLGKVAGAREAHGAPPGTYLVARLHHRVADRTLGARRGARDLAGAARGRRGLPPRLAYSVLARVRGGADEASPLCAAALSGDRASRRAHRSARRLPCRTKMETFGVDSLAAADRARRARHPLWHTALWGPRRHRRCAVRGLGDFMRGRCRHRPHAKTHRGSMLGASRGRASAVSSASMGLRFRGFRP